MNMLQITNPATGKIIHEVPADDAASIAMKADTARAAQPRWAATPLDERVAAMRRFRALLVDELEPLATTLTREVGKPLVQSRNEVNGLLPRIDFFIEQLHPAIADEHVFHGGGMHEQISHIPLGVVANISAWNYPYFVGGNVIVPALLTGNTVLYKPSEYATLTGLHIARLMHEAGYKIVGVADIHGGVLNTHGLGIPALLEYVKENKTVKGFPEGDPTNAQEILEQDCEILLPAAIESVINSKNAARIRARILVEGANSPTTPPADDILFERGVFVVPDILANAGGVTVSYFEWVQDRQGYFWPEGIVNDRLKQIMVAAFNDVVQYGEKHNVNNRIAAYMLAIDRVAFSVKLRGIYA